MSNFKRLLEDSLNEGSALTPDKMVKATNAKLKKEGYKKSGPLEWKRSEDGMDVVASWDSKFRQLSVTFSEDGEEGAESIELAMDPSEYDSMADFKKSGLGELEEY